MSFELSFEYQSPRPAGGSRYVDTPVLADRSPSLRARGGALN